METQKKFFSLKPLNIKKVLKSVFETVGLLAVVYVQIGVLLATVCIIIAISVRVIAYPNMIYGILATMTVRGCELMAKPTCTFNEAYAAVGISLLILAEVFAFTYCIDQVFKHIDSPTQAELLEQMSDELTEIRARMGEG